MTKNVVYEIAILGRIVWNFHSLNNEGSVGNVVEPRTITFCDGRQTDGISGEMLKHIHAEKMWELQQDKSKFCKPCQQLKPERADGNKDVRGAKGPEEAVTKALECTLCDLHGFLIQTPTVARTSLIEFGWAVGLPNEVFRTIHTHARHSVHEQYINVEEEKDCGQWDDMKCSEKECNVKPTESKLYKMNNKWYCEEHLPIKKTQMVYNRPTRSGVYAIISVFQPWRIGLNNVSLQYSKVEAQNSNYRKDRYILAMKAYQAMFLRPEGAMTTTRLPHTENFEGIIVVSKTNYPVPIISPLRNDYRDKIKTITKTINKNSIVVAEFNGLEEFTKKIGGLLEYLPYQCQTNDKQPPDASKNNEKKKHSVKKKKQ